MHPILGDLRRLSSYLASWIPIAALFAYLFHAGAMTWPESWALSLPSCLFYAFVCLSAWYSCRMTPWETAGAARLVVSHFAAAAVAGGLLVLASRLFAALLSRLPRFSQIPARLSRESAQLFVAGVLLYLLAVGLHYVLLAGEARREAQAREMESSVLAAKAELKALRAQINPHFVFNSLNSISALTTSDPAKAREMCILLAEFLRQTLGLGEKAAIPLREELDLARRFLAIEKVRFGSRLGVREEVEPGTLDFLVLPLILQPLVENAVLHGIAHLPEGGLIVLSARLGGGNLRIEIENNTDSDSAAGRRAGLGLANVRQRLADAYGDRANFRAEGDGASFRAAMIFPAQQAEPAR